MQGIATVLTPATSRDLVSIAIAREELSVDRSMEGKLRRRIREASSQVERFLNRGLARERVREVFHTGRSTVWELSLSRYPVASIESIIIDGQPLSSGDWELDSEAGLLWFNDAAYGFRACWDGSHVEVTYTGGYALPDGVEPDIAAAAMILLRHRLETGERDPFVRTEDVPGVLTTTYWVGGLPGEDPSMPPEAAALLSRYRNQAV